EPRPARRPSARLRFLPSPFILPIRTVSVPVRLSAEEGRSTPRSLAVVCPSSAVPASVCQPLPLPVSRVRYGNFSIARSVPADGGRVGPILPGPLPITLGPHCRPAISPPGRPERTDGKPPCPDSPPTC